MSSVVTIHVLAGGELYKHVLNAMTSFMNQESFLGLLGITALAGIIMATVGYMKTRDPMAFGKWFLFYVLATNIILVPKTNVMIDDLSSQIPKTVDNVPVIFALTASLMTTVGYGLAESYDALLAMPDDLQYTKTGALFGSRLIMAARDFRITDATLKAEMHQYFQSCVVGDIRVNQKYSVGDLSASTNLWELISTNASPLRQTKVNGVFVSCLEASKKEGAHSLYAKLNKEIEKSYNFFGINIFGKTEGTQTYKNLFETHLVSSFNYYQGLTDSASNIFLQAMMINAMHQGITHYQTNTDSAAGVLNQQFTKSQLQHRFSWDLAGRKALWFLPLLHTWLTLLLFGVFPLILALSTLPGGARILLGYLQFFLSLQFWPVLFAILNAGMTIYGSHTSTLYGAPSMATLDRIDELHNDIAGVAGYIMMLIPFLANGLVTSLATAFGGLATSMTGHVQGSTMAVAGEAAGGSFGLGQTSFYNSSANNFSANKHDSNWTHLHGMETEQMGSGVLKTLSGSGDTIFDAGPGMSRTAISINGSDALSGSLNQAFEKSRQSALNESRQFQDSVSGFAHRAMQLSELKGHDMRLGDGISENESGQYTAAISTMRNIATDVGKRLGIGTEEALAGMTSTGFGGNFSVSTNKHPLGFIAKVALGAEGKADIHAKYDRTSTSSDRFHENTDYGMSAREAQDFNKAFNYVSNFAKNHHFDESTSEGASLSSQLGADLRTAETASHNYDASLSKAARIQQAQSYVESHSTQINTDMNQQFQGYVAGKVGGAERDALFSNPGDASANHKLNSLADEFVQQRRDALIETFGTTHKGAEIDALYKKEASKIDGREAVIARDFSSNKAHLEASGERLGVGVDHDKVAAFEDATRNNLELTQAGVHHGGNLMRENMGQVKADIKSEIDHGKENAERWVVQWKNHKKNI